jgi:hypothetical protein
MRGVDISAVGRSDTGHGKQRGEDEEQRQPASRRGGGCERGEEGDEGNAGQPGARQRWRAGQQNRIGLIHAAST